MRPYPAGGNASLAAAPTGANGGRHAQRGIATLLIMLLIGMSLSAAVLGSAYYIRSTQVQSVSAHAQTQAQMKAWTAAEIVRRYLQQLQAASKLTAFLAQAMPIALDLSGDGATGLMAASITSYQAASSRVTVDVTGVTAPGTRAEASASLQVTFSTAGAAAASAPAQQCVVQPRSTATFGGDVSISGGETSITSPSGSSDIAVAGKLTISSASQAVISGCAKGDISLNGGGIDTNATLSSEGAITIVSMTPPVNAMLWGRSIEIGNAGTGSYSALRAGAYATSVLAGGSAIGTANVGGKLIPATTAKVIPWTTGTVLPPNSGSIVIALTDGTQYLLDLSKVSIAPATGLVTGTSSATRLSGTAALPASLTFQAQSIYGGAIKLYLSNVTQLWGNRLELQAYGGTYSEVLANAEFLLVDAKVGTLTGGSYVRATAMGYNSPTSYWNNPTFGSGTIAGKLYYGQSGTAEAVLPNLVVNEVTTSPGLPGIPYCDARADAISVDAYKAQANYVFEYVSGLPRLTIQNVKRSNGDSIAGVYSLRNPSVTERNLLAELMTCDYGNTPGCLQSGASWSINAISKFPTGVLWFDGSVTVNGTQVELINSIIGKGSVTLTTNTHLGLTAPNFSTPALVCDGNFFPANLCDKATSTTTFTTWKDTGGTTRAGLPIANMALLLEGGLNSMGWIIDGNVSLGGQISSGGPATSIRGSVSAGANSTAPTAITGGGTKITTTLLNENQTYVPATSCAAPSTPAATGGVTMLWSRYL